LTEWAKPGDKIYVINLHGQTANFGIMLAAPAVAAAVEEFPSLRCCLLAVN
jgi:hypothetical protein